MSSKLSPMLAQYQNIKSEHHDCVLFFRLGDFYEMFYDDAKVVSKILELVLTQRGKGTDNPVPMCGFPYHSADNYIARLIKAGYKIAICEQVEDPAQAKGLVKRDVTRIITPGTFLDENSTAARYLMTAIPGKKHIGLAFCDPVTGTLFTNTVRFDQPAHFIETIAKLPIAECVIPESAAESMAVVQSHPLIKFKDLTHNTFEDWHFNLNMAKQSLLDHFHVANLHGFGIENEPLSIQATGALLSYLKTMNKQPLKHIHTIRQYRDDDYLFISPAAFKGLEYDRFIQSIDHTLTAGGRRLLRDWCVHPLKHVEHIHDRQSAVIQLKAQLDIQHRLKTLLAQIPDVAKNISRLSCGYLHAKDFLAVRQTLETVPQIISTLTKIKAAHKAFDIKDLPTLRETICAAINPDAPVGQWEGKLIHAGYHTELDRLRDIQSQGKNILKSLQETEIKRTGIPSLKIGFNKVFGYYIEVTKAHLKRVPDDYLRKQTLTNAERFITPQLKDHEETILNAQDRILAIEKQLLEDIQNTILDQSVELHRLCQSLARLDVIFSMTTLASRPGYTQPVIQDSMTLSIVNGRHPVVEQTLSEPFVPNDTTLNATDQHLIILTGPNMAGKSTYIRQIALLVILAQMGSFIPAESAEIGLVDKVFTRIGAHDDINRGQSTFMVEMNETADILNNLTERSLVILDEIGRGTSTFDGLSLAWSLAEFLQNSKTRTLFATHFHELTALAEQSSGVRNYNVAVKEYNNEVIFLHKIIPGSSDDSYGIYVAQLAGIPKPVIQRAQTILKELEAHHDLKERLLDQNPASVEEPTNKRPDAAPRSRRRSVPHFSDPNQLTFFTPEPDPITSAVKNFMNEIEVNHLTPLTALNKLFELKNLINNSSEQSHDNIQT
jgi:DNA mismatch repair protein MutS